MKAFAPPFLFAFLVLVIAPVLAREIPVTSDIIKSQADALFIGDVKDAHRVGSRLSIEVAVVEKIFDRRNDVAGVVILNLHQQEAISNFKAGERYVFAASTCGNGAHILLGRQFAARVKNDSVDTLNWHGFGQITKLEALRSEFAKFKVKDQFLTDQVCKTLFDCHQKRESEIKGIP
ncbi:hypothetical protein [Lysobacter terrae]